tara:strand:- start:870 stop:3050 length:2181 start_codon:yes stop_codon:yes gene_type:complete
MILDWKNFVLRSDIKNLPLEEQRRKFLKEQLYHDNLLSEQKQRQYEFYMSQMQPKGGASGAGFSGIGVDGPIVGATVVSNVGTTITNTAGEFTFVSTPTGPITLTGGKDAITGVDFEGELVGFPQYKTISPITTFAHYLQQADAEINKSPMTIDEAITKTFESSSVFFGVEIPLEKKDVILQKDFVREAIENNNKVGISAQAVTTQIEAIAETVGASLAGSFTQQDFTKKFGKAGEIPQFRPENRKRTAYAALGRSVLDRGDINIEKVVDKIKYVNPITGNDKNDTIRFGNLKRLQDQLTSTIAETRTLARSEQFTNNYLTTRIQALNRAQKTTIKNEAATAVAGGTAFSNIQTVSTSTANFNGLSRIEKGKANETTEQLDKPNDWPSAGTFTQERFNTYEKTTFQEKLRFREGAIVSNYKYFGDVKDNPMLQKEGLKNTFIPASFDAAANNEFGPLNSDRIFAKSPLTHTTESVDDATGRVTTQTTIFRPFVLEQERGETPTKVGLRLSSLTTSVTQPKNTVEHLVQLGGDYTGTLTTNGKTETIFAIESGLTGPKANPIIHLDVIMAKGATAAFRLQPAKRSGTFELVDLNDSNKIVATNLSFVSDRLTAKFSGPKGANKELFIKFALTQHIDATKTYVISTLGIASKTITPQIGKGGQVSLPKFEYNKLDIEIGYRVNDGANSTFDVVNGGKFPPVATGIQFINDRLTFTIDGKEYVVTVNPI